MKKMKRFGAVLAALLLACTMSGCMGGVQLGNRAIVEAIGIDWVDENYRVTMQLAATEDAAKGSSPETVQVSGKTLTAIFSNASVERGKQLFLGNLQVVLFGEEMARHGIDEPLRFLGGNHQISPDLPTAVTRGQAEEFIRAAEDDAQFAAAGIVGVLKAAKKNGVSPQGRLLDLARASRSGDTLVPLLVLQEASQADESAGAKAEKPLLDQLLQDQSAEMTLAGAAGEKDQKKQQKKSLGLQGAVLFTRDTMRAQISQKEYNGFGWLDKGVRAKVVSAQNNEGQQIAAATHKIEAHITPELLGDNVVFNIAVKARLTLTETSFAAGDSLSDQELEYWAALFESEIRDEMERAFASVQRKGYDPMQMSLLVRQRYPQYYAAHSGDWGEVLRQAGYPITVRCTIDRVGTER